MTEEPTRDFAASPGAAAAYASLAGRFETARSRRVAGDHVRVYRISGRPVRIRVLGKGLAETLDRALAHLRVEDRDPPAPELEIDLWDEAETGVAADPDANPIDRDAPYPFAVSPDQRFMGQCFPESVVWFDRSRRTMVGSITDHARLSCAELGRPVEWPLLFWLRDLGTPLLHASCVAHDGRGALFLGRGGAGKSTAAAACACASFEFVCDDKLALQPAAGGFEAWGLNGSVGLDAAALRALPALAPHAIAPRHAIDEKWLVFVGEAFPGRLRASAPVDALLIPRRGAPATRTRPASPKEALLAAAPNTLLWLPIDRARSLDRLGDLVARVPAYWLELGPDPNEIPTVVAALLQTSHIS